MEYFRQYKFGFDVWGLIVFLAFILFAIDRKNLLAIVFASGFNVCHLVFAIVNFI